MASPSPPHPIPVRSQEQEQEQEPEQVVSRSERNSVPKLKLSKPPEPEKPPAEFVDVLNGHDNLDIPQFLDRKNWIDGKPPMVTA